MKSQGDSSFPTIGHKAILNKLNSRSKTNRKRTNIYNWNKPQQKHRLGTVSNKLLGGLNRFYVGVRQQAPNYALYGKLGKFSLSVISKEKTVKFWLKILRNTESLTFKVFKAEIDATNNNLTRIQVIKWCHWATGIKLLMESLGFDKHGLTSLTTSWCSHINSTPRLEYYSIIKHPLVLKSILNAL